jgi:hypothetical protein
MSRYLQKISLLPYSEAEIWTGWELENRSGDIPGLVLADGIADEILLATYGVSEFLHIPARYIADDEFRPTRTG